jgi:hypothetical protein
LRGLAAQGFGNFINSRQNRGFYVPQVSAISRRPCRKSLPRCHSLANFWLRVAIIAAGYAPSDEHECAIVTTLAPGNYTAVLSGLNNTTGVALFELYNLNPQSSNIANVSTRGHVGTDENVMIGGFIVGGDQSTNVIVRALGPTLTDFG